MRKPFLPWCVAVWPLVFAPVWVARAGPDPLAAVAQRRAPHNRALVFFYRESAFQANWFDYRIADGGQTVGSVRAGTFFPYLATPGEHTFQVRLIAGSRTTLTLEGGHVYYLRADGAYEVLYERPQLSLVPATEGATIVSSLNTRTGPRLVGKPLPLPPPRHGLLSY